MALLLATAGTLVPLLLATAVGGCKVQLLYRVIKKMELVRVELLTKILITSASIL